MTINSKSNDIVAYVDKAIAGNDLDAIKKLDDLGIEIFVEYGNNLNTLSRFGLEKMKPEMFNYVLGSDNLFPAFKDNGAIRFDVFKMLVEKNREDSIDAFIANGGIEEWDWTRYRDLHTFIHDKASCFKNGGRAVVKKALEMVLPFNDSVLKNPYPLLMCAALVADKKLIRRLIKEEPISLEISDDTPDLSRYTHRSRKAPAEEFDARYILSDVFNSHSSFSEKIAVVNELAALGMDIDLLGRWHDIEISTYLSREDSAAKRASRFSRVETGPPSMC